MPALYRVVPFLADSQPDEPGGDRYIPPQGAGRFDNPEVYSVLYLSGSEAGAIAEAFGRFPEWTPAILSGSPSLLGSLPALGRYRLAEDAQVCNLDDPARLAQFNLRPSEVVSRDHVHTRAWARRIFDLGQFAGVRWWSCYDPQWASVGLWDVRRLTVEEVRPLRLSDPALVEASRTIMRRIVAVRC